MFKKLTRIALSLALLLYSVGIQALDNNIFPTGEDTVRTQPPTPPASDEILKGSQFVSTPGTAKSITSSVKKTGDAISKSKSNPAKENGNNAGKRRNPCPNGSNPTRGDKAHSNGASTANSSSATLYVGRAERNESLIRRGYIEEAGRALVMTDGYRAPSDQARVIFNNIRAFGVRYVRMESHRSLSDPICLTA